jgi:hypothetical protein
MAEGRVPPELDSLTIAQRLNDRCWRVGRGGGTVLGALSCVWAAVPRSPQPLLADIERPGGTGTVRHARRTRQPVALSDCAMCHAGIHGTAPRYLRSARATHVRVADVIQLVGYALGVISHLSVEARTLSTRRITQHDRRSSATHRDVDGGESSHQAWSRHSSGSPTQNGQFAPEYDNFQLLEVIRGTAQGRQLQEATNDEIAQREQHGASTAVRYRLFYASARRQRPFPWERAPQNQKL